MKNIKEKLRMAALPVSTAIMMAPVTMSAFAADAGTGVEGINLATITNDAMSQIKSDMMIVIAASTTAAVALTGITVGVAYMLKRAKSLKNVG